MEELISHELMLCLCASCLSVTVLKFVSSSTLNHRAKLPMSLAKNYIVQAILTFQMFSDKIDLVMWTCNSAKTLPIVLQRISEVIPKENINRKIITDDHSVDQTVEIAKSFGWEVYKNKGRSLKANKETALSCVSTPVFASFEHDILLSRDWWDKVSTALMSDPKVAVVQGIRLATDLKIRKLDEYIYAQREYRSLDNNLYRTDVVKTFGLDDVHSALSMKQAGYSWLILDNVVSDHIRGGVIETVEHDLWIHLFSIHSFSIVQKINCLRMLLSSPIRAFDIALKTKCFSMLLFYPVDRLAIFVAYVTRPTTRNSIT